jgi:hypothetical protein
MKPFYSIFYIAITSLIITSCAYTKSTQYQSKSLTGGYTETRLGEDVYEVWFNGNSWTTPEKTTDLCLLRCAEISEQNNSLFLL